MADLKTTQTETAQPEKPKAKASKAKASAAPSSYVASIPSEVMAEYRLLTRKRRLQPISVEEEARLKAAMDVISEYDRNSPSAQLWRKKNEEIAAALERINQKAQAIIDARDS